MFTSYLLIVKFVIVTWKSRFIIKHLAIVMMQKHSIMFSFHYHYYDIKNFIEANEIQFVK